MGAGGRFVLVYYNKSLPPRMTTPIDPSSPVPLYHQIAERIRERILSGELAPGQALKPLRQAAEIWGVNLHTVRHAYTALAREGLVETQAPRGTRVRARATSRTERGAAEAFDDFLDRFVDEARRTHGLSSAELAGAIGAREERSSSALPVVYVVECSEWQCRTHAGELRERYALDARPWPLDQGTAPPEGGVVLSTFFHYNDVRRAWPRRLRDVHFVTIALAQGLEAELDALRGQRARLEVGIVERDAITAENVAADVSALLPRGLYAIHARTIDDPVEALEALGDGEAALFAPRVWGTLSEEQRAHPRALEARYAFDAEELDQVARTLGWRQSKAAARETDTMVRSRGR